MLLFALRQLRLGWMEWQLNTDEIHGVRVCLLDVTGLLADDQNCGACEVDL
jgi:hypothetical protein